MATRAKAFSAEHVRISKKTSIGRNPKMSSMNKSKKASYKKYRGQGQNCQGNQIMKIEVKIELDTIEDKDIGSEFVDLLILLKERIESLNDTEE